MNSILLKLKQHNIKIALKDDDNLEISSHDKKIPDELLSEIRDHKETIIDHLKAFRDVDAFRPIPVFAAEESYPLAHPQKRLWVVSQIAEASAAYNMFSHVFLRGTYKKELFAKAVQALVKRHEALRTVFRQDESGEVRQWVIGEDALPYRLQYHDLNGAADALGKAELLIREDQYLPYDLENGPLFRVMLLRLQEEEYCFYVNIHHIISDGWSMDIFSRDLIALYDGLEKDPGFCLPELRIQYKDFTLWQLSRHTPKEMAKHKDYWLTQLSGELPVIDLPSALVRPAYKAYNGRSLFASFDPDTVQFLKQYCEFRSISLYTGVLASLFVVFRGYTRADDLIIGTALAGRDHVDLHNQIGFYINTLAIRNRFGPSDSFDDVCSGIKDALFEGMLHQDYTLDMILPDLALQQDAGRNPVFDVMFTFQNVSSPKEKGGGMLDTDTIVQLDDCVAKFDIDITLGEVGDTLEMVLKYNADVYEEHVMKAFIRHFQQAIRSCMMSTDRPIDELDMLTEEDLALQQNGTDDADFACPEDASVVTLFRKAAVQYPDSVALVSSGRTMSYEELDKFTDQLAGYLYREYQIVPGDFIGIQLDRNEHFIIAVLGILKCGAVYVPVDPELPEASKAYITSDANLKLLITETAYIFDISYCDAPVFAIDVEFEPDGQDNCPEVVFDARDLIYIIYTSGTTGKPKGVMVEHRGVINLIASQAAYFNVRPDDQFILFSNFAFDASVEQIYLALLHGATLHLVTKLDILDIDRFSALLKEKRITHLHAVPSFLRELPYFEGASLKRIVSGGDSFDNHIYKVWHKSPGIRIINEYGPTETTVTAIQTTVDSLAKGNRIGKPLPNTYCYILNDHLCRQFPGVVGELYIGGDGVARGYLNKPELTAAAFLNNPFRPGEKFYKTGDLARYLPDGTLEFIGRSDTQIKMNGYRIELSNIEYYLEKHPSVRQVAVLLNQSDSGIQELVACIVASGDGSLDNLRTYLSERLPAYMVPHHFVLFDKFPLTAIGKVDRKALQAKKGTEIAKDEFIPVKTDKERILADVFKEVLKQEQISIRDNFYKLGGDSIKSIQVVSRLKQKGYNLKVEQVLRTPLIEELAKLMDENYQEVDQSSVSGPVDLTPIQQYFFTNENIREHHHYNQSVVLKSREPIHTETLKRSLTALVRHHDALRMIFVREEATWKQINQYTQGEHFDIFFHDLTGTTDPLSRMEAIGAQVQAGFELHKGPLFKVIHLRMDDGDHLCLLAHHLVVDGVSWRILLEDLAALYGSYRVNTLPNLPLKTSSYQHWAAGLRAYVAAGKLNKEMDYWQSISDPAAPGIPQKTRNNGAPVRFSREEAFSLDMEQTTSIFRLHKVYNTEVNDILLTALALALRAAFGIRKSTLLLEGHGREEIIDGIDIGRTVGWFTTIYPFSLDISTTGDDQFEALIQVKEALRKIPNKGIGYGMLKYFEQAFRSVPESGIAFNYLGDFGKNVAADSNEVMFEFSGESIGANSSGMNSQDITLDISGMIVSEVLSMSFRFDDTVYDTEGIALLASEYRNALVKLIAALQEKQDRSYVTSSDLTCKALSHTELEYLNERYQLEDIYELSPLQSGIYYHWLADPKALAYFEQIAYRIKARDLDLDLVKKAYDMLVSRYAILRTSFTHEYAGLALQIVHRSVPSNFSSVKIPVTAGKEEAIAAIREQDKAVGFDLEQHSQMRLKVLDLGDGSYEFIWSNHHILMDGWCVSILINEFYTILMSLTYKQPLNLPEPLKYSDYIKWLSHLDRGASLTYWEQYLSGIETVTDVPFRIKSGESVGVSFKKASVNIDGPAFAAVQQLCHKLAITPNIFVQAVWGYLLSRYNNVQDIVFGAVVSGRPGELAGVEQMIGLFINTIPVRVNYHDTDTPAVLLKRLQAQALQSAAHHYMNLSEVQSLSALGADLIRTLMVFENYAVQEAVTDEWGKPEQDREQDIAVEDIDVFEQTNYDFSVIAVPGSAQLKVDFKYNPSVFDESLVGRLTSHFFNVVHAFVSEEDTPLAQIAYLTVEEQGELLHAFNDTSLPYPGEKTLPELFEEQVTRTPSNNALVFGNLSLTYAELNEAANRVACYLRQECGVKPEDLIGVKLDRSERMLIAILGILKAGAAYVPIDPAFPAERIAYIERDIDARLIIDEQAFVICNQAKECYSAANPEIVNKPGDLAYVIYTSGTTGKPRGVMVQHNNLVSRISYYREYYGLSTADTTLFYRSFCFDGALEEYLVPLFAGAQVIIAPSDFAESPQENLITAIDRYKVTKVNMPPLLLNDLLSEPFKGRFTGLASLKHVVSGGDVWRGHLLKDVAMRAKFYNSYGPTENTIDSTNWQVILDYNSRESVIGQPVFNTQVYILDDRLRLMPVGVTGKIYVAGAGVARGYLNNRQLTTEKFIANPFGAHSLMYDTGDLGCWLPDGNIQFSGRRDKQVKIRGYRIELGEIESALLGIDTAMKQVLVTDREFRGAKTLVAYYVTDRSRDRKELKAYLQKRLPEYMIPSFYMELDRIPLTRNGKIDYTALPGFSGIDLVSKEYVAPVTPREKAIVSVWSEVLKRERISTTDNFYSLGGDSIKSIHITSKLKQAGYALELRYLLDALPVAELAKKMKKTDSSEAAHFYYKQDWEPGEETAVSPNQMRFLKSKYNRVVRGLSTGISDKDSFEGKFRDFLAYFPVLCVAFREQDGLVLQRYVGAAEVKVEFTWYPGCEEQQVHEKVYSYFKQPYDLFGGALIRVLIFPSVSKGEDQEQSGVYIGMHHALADDYTANVIQQQADSYFNQKGQVAVFVNGLGFPGWQQAFLASAEGLRLRKYWTDTLQYISLRKPGTPANTKVWSDFIIQEITFQGTQLAALQELAARLSVPLSAVFLGLYLSLLGKVGTAEKSLAGIMVNGREQYSGGFDTEQLLGVIDNVLPLPYAPTQAEVTHLFIRSCYQRYLEAREIQQVPYEVIRKDVLEMYGRDIDTYLAGNFNWLVSDKKSPETESGNRVIVSSDSFDWHPGINLTCVLHPDALELTLLTEKGLYQEEKALLCLQSQTDILIKLLND